MKSVKMVCEWRMFGDMSRSYMEKLIVQSSSMTPKCKLLFCPKLSCSLEYAIESCWCTGKDKNTGVKKITIVDLNSGSFRVNKEGSWFFKSKEGHVWSVDKLPDKPENRIEMTELDVVSEADSLKENPEDILWPIYPRVTLVKRRVLKMQQIKVMILENPPLPTKNHS